MLAQGLHTDISRALALLKPDHPERAVYLEYIQRQLLKGGVIDANALTTRQFLLGRVKRKWDTLKSRFSG